MKVKEMLYKEVCKCEDDKLKTEDDIIKAALTLRSTTIRQCIKVIEKEVKI